MSHGKTQQFDAMAFISGDTSKFFNLPGGPIGFVLGAEYRTDNLAYDQDPQIQLGYTFYNAIPTFKAPKQKVNEAFGEIRIPIVKDRPFLRELEVDGAARVSRLQLGTTGTVWAYNGNVIYSPVQGPSLARQLCPLGARSEPGRTVHAVRPELLRCIADPCDVNQIGAGTTNRAANCAAGVPAGTQLQYNDSLQFQPGGNSNLEAEKSDSITIGGVLTPTFIPGFSASVDYYNIKVKKAISGLTAQFIVNKCYDLPR